MHNKKLHMVTFLLVIVGGVNWGLVGLFGFDLVAWLFVDLLQMPILERAVFVVVGLAAVYELWTHKRKCSDCEATTHKADTGMGGVDMPGAPGAI